MLYHRMRRSLPTSIISFFVLLGCLGAFGTMPAAKAQEPLAGKYRCVKIEFDRQSGACQSPPLILSSDGSYQIWGERGTYQVVRGQWLVLSHSKRRGMGHIENPHEIIFEYRVDKRTYRVTFRELIEAPPGVSLG
jgi:hypothetical protein